METNIKTKDGVSVLSLKTDFNEMLEKNFAAICKAIAYRGKAIKELVDLYEKRDDIIETSIKITRKSEDENAAKMAISKELEISPQTAHFLLDRTIDEIALFNKKELVKMLNDYKANISKLVV